MCRNRVWSRIRFGCKWRKIQNGSGFTRLVWRFSCCPQSLKPLPAHHLKDWPSLSRSKCSIYIPSSRIKKRASEEKGKGHTPAFSEGNIPETTTGYILLVSGPTELQGRLGNAVCIPGSQLSWEVHDRRRQEGIWELICSDYHKEIS